MSRWQLPPVSVTHEVTFLVEAHCGQGRRRPHPRRRECERGAALLLVVWIFIVLFVVVLDFASSMRDDGLASANFADETQAYYIALGGLNRAIYDVLLQLEEDPDAFSADDQYDNYEASDEQDDGSADLEAEDEDLDELDQLDEEAEQIDEGGQVEDLEEPISSDGRWHLQDFGGGSYAVRMLDESGKISLNRADPQLLRRVVRRLLLGGNATEGASVGETREIDTVVDSILDWRDPDDLRHDAGVEGDYYESLPRPYPIKDGAFDSVDELLLVKGVTPDLFYGTSGGVGLTSLFSVFNRSGWINVLRAPAPVLRVLFDLDEEGAEELIAEREESPSGFVGRMREMMFAVDPALAQRLRGGRSSMVTVESHGRFGERGIARVAAIVDLSDSFDGARVFRWYDRVPAGWDPGGAGLSDDQMHEDGKV